MKINTILFFTILTLVSASSCTKENGATPVKPSKIIVADKTDVGQAD